MTSKTKNELIEEVLRLGAEFDQPFAQNACRVIRDLKAQRDMAVEALEKYADPKAYEKISMPIKGGGEVGILPLGGASYHAAQQTLAKIKSDEWVG